MILDMGVIESEVACVASPIMLNYPQSTCIVVGCLCTALLSPGHSPLSILIVIYLVLQFLNSLKYVNYVRHSVSYSETPTKGRVSAPVNRGTARPILYGLAGPHKHTAVADTF